MSYQPRPIDLAHVALTEEIVKLIERLAENAHDGWAAKRMTEGWTLGPKRPQADSRCWFPTPSTESEAIWPRPGDHIKAILALGYRIEKSE